MDDVPDITMRPWYTAAYPEFAPDAPQNKYCDDFDEDDYLGKEDDY